MAGSGGGGDGGARVRVAPLAVELCAGTGVLSAALRARGWRTITVDADAAHGCDVTADVRGLDAWALTGGERPAFAWGAPPCEEFSRFDMPWTRKRNPPPPDLSIVTACADLVRAWRPAWWGIENTRGALPFLRPLLGEHAGACGRSWFWWGVLPPLVRPMPGAAALGRWKEGRTSSARAARASYHPGMVAALADSIDSAVRLFGGE